MSYCRFSSDNWRSDVYAYADVSGGYTTHVASNRVIGDVPTLPRFDNRSFLEAYRRQMDFLRDAKREPIGGPYDGDSFNDEGLEEFLARLLSLREAGYYVPDGAIEAVREEIADAPAAKPDAGEQGKD